MGFFGYCACASSPVDDAVGALGAAAVGGAFPDLEPPECTLSNPDSDARLVALVAADAADVDSGTDVPDS